jgi:hypothetical protein
MSRSEVVKCDSCNAEIEASKIITSDPCCIECVGLKVDGLLAERKLIK